MKSILPVFILFISSLVTAQTDASAFDASVPNHYFDFSLKLVKETPGFSPPVAARAFGFMGLTLYESVVPGMPGYISTKDVMYEFHNITSANPDADYHWPTVANNAMALIIDSLFRTATAVNKDSLQAIKTHYNDLYSGQISAQSFADSKEFGEAIAIDVLNYSRTDGGHNAFATNFPASYIPPVGPDLWVPFGNQVALQPYWGTHRPFIEADTIEAISGPPPAFSIEPGSDFYIRANEVYEKGVNLTSEEMTIAQYWADGGGSITPAGHSISMLKNILTDENSNLETAAIGYAKLGIALSDAFLACWKTKFIYNLCRPVTYIQSHIDSSWLSFIGTPPFPEYTSGHSSQSGAMASVMTDMFGSTYEFTDRTHGTNFGGPRSFDSFEEAAAEAAVSRLYGGIHYEFGNEGGLTLGYIVGVNVNELFEQLNVATENPSDEFASIEMYPNPVQDMMTVKSNEDFIGSGYQLLDVNGKVVSNGKISETNTTLNLASLSAGVYLFRIGDAHSYRVVKN